MTCKAYFCCEASGFSYEETNRSMQARIVQFRLDARRKIRRKTAQCILLLKGACENFNDKNSMKTQ